MEIGVRCVGTVWCDVERRRVGGAVCWVAGGARCGGGGVEVGAEWRRGGNTSEVSGCRHGIKTAKCCCRAFAVCLDPKHMAKSLFAVCPDTGHTAKGLFAVCI